MQNNIQKKSNFPLEESSWFKDFFQNPFFKHDQVLKTDIIENNNTYTLLIEAPGIAKEDIKISLEEGNLTIEINQTSQKEDTETHYIKKERWNGVFTRTYYIGNSIKPENIIASFKNGILEISFEKEKLTSQTKYISIN